MALDRLRELGFYVFWCQGIDGVATIEIHFKKLTIDLDSGTVNGRDILSTVGLLDAKIKSGETEESIVAHG